MKKVLVFILFIFVILLNGCSTKDYEASKNVYLEQNYTVKTETDATIFGIEGINYLFAEDEFDYIGAVFYCKTKEDAEKVYEIVYNMYLDIMYNSDIYGFENTYKLEYDLIEEPEIYLEVISKIDYNLLASVKYSSVGRGYLFGSLSRAYQFPIMPLPDTYSEFLEKKDYYTPQCFIEGMNVYFGSKVLLDLIV